MNTIPATALSTLEGGTNPNPAAASLALIAPPTIAKAFSPATIPLGGTSTITFTVTNPNSAAVLPAGLTRAGFSDTLTDMVIAAPPNVGGTCTNLGFATAAGGSSFVASGMRLLPGASCTVTVNVTSTVPGVHPNQTSGVVTAETPTPGLPSNTANLTVGTAQPLTLAKTFIETEVLPGAPARLVITIGNPNVFPVTLGSPAFTDVLPGIAGDGLDVYGPPDAVTTCGGTVDNGIGGAPAAGDKSVRLTGGTVPAGGSCYVAINLRGFPGSWLNITSALSSSVGTTPGASDTLLVSNILAIASGVEPVRNVTESDNSFFVNSILGPLDTLGGLQATTGPGGNVTLTNLGYTAPGGQPNLSLTPDGTIVVAGGSQPGTYTVTYTICQNGQPANCAPPRTESVVIAESVIVATTDYGTGAPPPLVVKQADFDQEPGNVLGPNDTLDGAQATVAPGTGGNVDLTVVSVTGPGGPTTVLGVNVNTGIITVASGTPPGDYTITYRICEDDNATNCATATETVRVRVTPIVAATEPDRNVFGADLPVPAGNIIGPGDLLDGVQATVGPAATGNVDLRIDSILNGAADASALIAVDLDTGAIVAAPGTPDGTYVISYTICEETNRGNCASATETVIVTSRAIAAGPEAPRNVTGSDGPVTAGSVLNGANDTLNGAPATVGPGGNVVVSVVPGANSDPDLSVNPVTGIITVAAGTPAGTYTVEYRICEKVNTDNCATAIETVIVTDTPIVAAPEPDRPLIAADAPQTAGSVLASGDRINGAPAVAGFGVAAGGNVVLTQTSGGSPQLTLNPNTGIIAVAGGTGPGTYTINYEICEPANRDNCASATETVVIAANPIAAGTEPDRPTVQADLPQPAGNVLDPTNDTLAGNPATVGGGGNVVVSVVTSDPELSLDLATGELTVAANTPAGSYTIEYRICEAAFLANCATATETVTVSINPILAGAEADRPLFSTDLPQPAGSVLGPANDLLSGVPAVPGAGGNVVLTPVSGSPELTLDPATGEITVAADTGPGTYTITYRICEAANLSNCATATETVVITNRPIVAAPEADRPVTGSDDPRTAGSVLGAGDLLDGAPATVGSGGNVILSLVPGANTAPELSLDPLTGTITVAGGTPPGTYTIEYRICEAANLENCATAIETVLVTDNTIAAGPEFDRPITGADLDQSAGNVLDPANDRLLGAPAVPGPGGNVVLTIDSIAPELTLDTDSGELTIGAGAGPGNYTVTYRICEVGNSDNCAIATETVVVTDLAIVAGPEPDRPLRSLDLDQPAGNVLDPANDRLDGAPAVPGPGGNVELTIGSSDPELSVDTLTGDITVAADTGPGTYTVTYTICEVGNADNCATATETVVISNTPIQAGPEADRPLFSTDAAQPAGNVLDPANDLLDGAPAVPGAGGNVVLTPVSGSPELVLDPATGEITVAADTGPGTYTITYRICEVANLDNCATATETVVIVNTPIEANGITFPLVDTAVGGSTPPVTTDDLLGGVEPIPGAGGTVVITVVTPASDPGVVLDPETGIIAIAPGTPEGVYTITYRICEAANLDNCATATETVEVIAITANPEPFPPFATDGGTTTSVLASDLEGGVTATLETVVITVISADDGVTLDPATGLITLEPGQPAGSYEVIYEICSVAYPTACDQTTETVVQLPIGILETVKTLELTDNGDGIDGVGDTVTFTITVRNGSNVPVTDVRLTDTFTAMDGTPLVLGSGPDFVSADQGSPAGALLIGETATYTASYVLTIDTVTRGGVSNSATALATTVIGAGIGGSPVEISDISDDGNDLDGNLSDDPTELALAPAIVPSGLTLTKTTPRGVVERGGVVPYTIELRNDTAAAIGPVDMIDDLPAGFLYVPGSARLNGAAVTVAVDGRHVVLAGVVVPPLSTVTLTLAARVLTGAQAGEHVNTATVRDPATGALLTAPATATVRIVPEPVFDCGDVIGKVFDDRNRDGYQNPAGPRPVTNDSYGGKLDPSPSDKHGEPGIPGVRLAGVDGTIITTDAHGRFHVPCAMLPADRGSNFILKVDPRSLPAGYRLTTENPRVVRLTPGKMTEMNFGAAITRVVRIDLNRSAFVAGTGGAAALSPALLAGIAQLLPQIADEAVNLRLSYYIRPGGGSEADLAEARRRLKLVESHIRKEWQKVGRVKLTIETSIQRQAK
jgi:uncharacterized repeat protein (TIGR01451 family)